MNNLDKQYTDLLQDILDNGVTKQDRTGTGTISVFGRQIRHKMSEGFPLLTTKKMSWKQIVTELLWFLRGNTNIKYLVDNNCHIWDGDAYKNYEKGILRQRELQKKEVERLRNSGKLLKVSLIELLPKEEFINKIKTDDEFAKKWGDLGPVYGKQWRAWTYLTREQKEDIDGIDELICGADMFDSYRYYRTFDQIANSINLLKTDPDSRRLMVNAWNVGELDQMVLPPCHYGFQVYTRELSYDQRFEIFILKNERKFDWTPDKRITSEVLNELNIPTRAISLMWNQRSVDTPLGLPFNIASYGLLLEIIAKAVNMVPDELIGNLGDCHIYLNQVDGVKEQIGRELSLEERREMVTQEMFNQIYTAGDSSILTHSEIDQWDVPRIKTREPYPLPTLNINTEFWPTESGECGVGPVDAQAVFNNFTNEHFCKCLLEEDLQLSNYQSHPTIKFLLSN
jgi:thymidylate synthase